VNISRDAGDLLAVQELCARYWARADGDLSCALSDLFTFDGELVLGSLSLAGLVKIERFFVERDATQAASQRTTRHFASNYVTTPAGQNRLRVRSLVQVYVGIGDWPMESAVPSGIADFDDLCVFDPGQGRWQFARREGRSVFVGPGAARFAR
jgi:hypothetical protein